MGKAFLAWALAALPIAFPATAHAASFDCAKAATRTEKAVCADPALSKLDERVAAAFTAQLAASDAPNWKPYLRMEQRGWLRDRDGVCKADAACLKQDYQRRLVFLYEGELKFMGRYVAGRCPKDGAYLDITPSYPGIGVEVQLYVCPNPQGNMLLQGAGSPDPSGVLAIMDAGCRRELHFGPDQVTVASRGGDKCRAFADLDGVYRRDPAKSPYGNE